MSRNLHVGAEALPNPSANPSFRDVLLSRRELLKAGLGSAVVAALAGCATPGTRPDLGFRPLTASSDDLLRVPPEYEARVLYRWGDPVGVAGAMPEFKPNASNSAAEQAVQAGMHHDGMHFFPLPRGTRSSTHGLLVMNHEYLDEGLLYSDGQKTWSAEKVAKAQNAVGVSVIEVRLEGAEWRVVRPSPYARRITAQTLCVMAGPATGHALMRTAVDPVGRLVRGTYNGCAHGWTPWGTYLTCEENWHFNFVNGGEISADQRRYRMTAKGRGYRWEEHDARFDAARHPNEFHRFGWVVEIDPYDPSRCPSNGPRWDASPTKAPPARWGANRRLAFYMGDDWNFEYVYKFVPRRAWEPGNPDANRDLLDDGILYVARFNADGSGDWLPLVPGTGPLTAANGFARSGRGAGADAPGRGRRGRDQDGSAGMGGAAPGDARGVLRVQQQQRARDRRIRGRQSGQPPRAEPVRPHRALAGATRDPRPRASSGTCGSRGARRRSAAPSRETSSRAPTGYGSTRWARCGFRPTSRPRSLGAGDFAPLGNNQLLAVDRSDGHLPALPHGAARLRDHRLPHDAGQPYGVRQHPASGRGAGGPIESGESARQLQLARLRP